MSVYAYKVVPAPVKGLKGKGVKGPEARFSNAIEALMNEMAADGWEYQRAETLPSVERAGLTGSTTQWRNVLVFRRLRDGDASAFSPELLPAPAQEEAPAPKPEPRAEPKLSEEPAKAVEETPVKAAPEPPKDPLQATLSAVRNAAKSDS